MHKWQNSIMNKNINKRVAELRLHLRKNGLAAYIFPSTDPHHSEYPPEYWKTREWISGFNGSAGTAVVTSDDAALWTDSRYFIAAEEQLKDTPFRLMKERLEGTPSVTQWLAEVLPPGSAVGMDAWTNSADEIRIIREELTHFGLHLEIADQPADTLWKNRPALPDSLVRIQPPAFAGRSITEKLALIREAMAGRQADGLILSALDEIAWTLNLRGTDVHCTPVFVAYTWITPSRCTLYINKVKLTEEVSAHLKECGVETRNYTDILPDLSRFDGKRIWTDCQTTNYALCRSLPETCSVVDAASPVGLLKAVKHPAEVEGYRRAMLRDGVVMVKFLKWLTPAVQAGGQTELSISRKLEELRSEQDLFCGNSFDTIAGYAHHGAVVHYEPTPETDLELLPKGLLLLDSGAQYEDGTTDITRTIARGPVNEEERHDYTLVLKGHIRLARAKFPQGCSGTQLDACARYAMWQEGINYLHGTGHGVGSCLCVHEGPHQIRMNYMPSPLLPYMTVTNEPGIYKEGRHGIRIENTQIILPYRETEFGTFLQFDPLTLCPIDMEPIDWSLLDTEEIEWLNRYHSRVYDQLAPLLDHEHRTWLREATRPYEYTKPSQKS